MTKRLVLLAALATTLCATGAMAGPEKGKWGLGYFSAEAPVGARYWVNPKVGIDLGLGFSQNEGAGDGFAFDLGVPFVLGNYENAYFFLRPGFLYQSVEDSFTQYALGVDFGVEWYINKRFGLQVAHGLAFSTYDPEVGDSNTTIATRGLGISSVGFHFYFK